MAQEGKAKTKSLHIPLSSQWKNESSIANDGQPAISPMTELAINFKQSCKRYVKFFSVLHSINIDYYGLTNT